MTAIPRSGPPQHDLVAGAGQRNVCEPQILAALLAHVLLPCDGRSRPPRARRRSCARRRPAGRERRPAAGLVRDPARLPQKRHVDDRELESLAAVDRQHLDRLGVRFEPPAALLVAGVLVGFGDPGAQPCGQRRRAELLLGRGGVQQLADVAQVGEPALSVDARSASWPAAPRAAVIVSSSDATPAAAQDPRPVVQPAVDLLPGPAVVVVGGRELLGGPADERRQRGGMGADHRRRAARAPRAARSQSRAGPVANTLPAPLITAGTPASPSASRTSAAWRFVRTSTARWSGLTSVVRSRAVLGHRGARVQQRDDVGGEVGDDVLSGARLAREAVRGSARSPGPRAATTRIRIGAPTGAPVRRERLMGLGGADLAVGDPLVPELDAGQQRVVGVDQPLVAAPVDRQRRRGSGRVARRRGRRTRRRRGTRRSPAWGRRSGPA